MLARTDFVHSLAAGGLVVALAVALLQWPAARGFLAPLVPSILIVLGVGLVAAARFDRSGVAVSLSLLLLADRAVRAFGDDDGSPLVDAVAVLLPLNLGAFTWLPERGLFSRVGRARVLLVMAEILVVALLALPGSRAIGVLLSPSLIPAVPARLGTLTQPALAAFALTSGLMLVRAVRQRSAMDGAAFWALVAAALALTAEVGVASTVFFAAAGLVLMIALLESWHGMAYVDELTGLPERRALTDALRRLPSHYAVAMVDVDHFRRFNETHGHPVADQVLKMVASKLAAVSGGGRAFRYGGEEFAILFPGKSVAETLPHVDNLRQAIAASAFVLRGRDRPATRPDPPRPSRARPPLLTITVSIGVAGAERRKRATPEDVVHAADAALYRAKRAGRNRVST